MASGRNKHTYVSGKTVAELCAQYGASASEPERGRQGEQALGKALRLDAYAELVERLGEAGAEEAVAQFAEGRVPKETADKPVENEKPERVRDLREMYVEQQTDGARDLQGRGHAMYVMVSASKTGGTLYAAGKTFERLKGSGVSGTYRCVEDGNAYWIAAIKKDGSNRRPGGRGRIVDRR